MSTNAWKSLVNKALFRATGYTLTRETAEQRAEAVRAAARAEAQRVRKATRETLGTRHRAALRSLKESSAAERREAVKQERAAVRRRVQNDFLRSYDAEVGSIIEQVEPRTMTGPPKLTALIEAVRYVVRNDIPGEVVECGVWRGGSMQAIALTLLSLGVTDRELHLFDTFEGMPPPTEEDTQEIGGETVQVSEMLAKKDRSARIWAVAGLDDVQEGMAEVAYPADKIHYHQGLVEETTPGQAPGTIALLRLDTDWYASTRHELEHLYDRLSPGGILILDDYGSWEGARKAVDEWLAETGTQLFLAPMGAGRIAVKPVGSR